MIKIQKGKMFFTIFFFTIFFNCKNKINDSNNSTTISDNKITEKTLITSNHQSNQIETITIGAQIWASKNLDVSTFKNGDTIFNAKSNEQWNRATKLHIPAYCYYDNNPENGKIYGKLYNWFAVMDERGLAPEGYYIPNNVEYWMLLNSYGLFYHSNTAEQENAGLKLKSGIFRALLGGIRYEFGGFSKINDTGSWWTSENVWNESLNQTKSNVNPSEFSVDKYFASGPGAGMLNAGCGFSVRCLKGNLNKTIKIPMLKNEYIELDKDGKPLEGRFFWENSFGNVSREFIKGIENGERKTYDRRGDLISLEYFKEGVLNGLSSYYSYYGTQIDKEGNYENGEKVGEWIIYDWKSNGKDFDKLIRRKENYENGVLVNKIDFNN